MLVYEEDRTESIVKRLILVGRFTRFHMIIIWLVTAGLFCASVGRVSIGDAGFVIGGIIGALLGYHIGTLLAGLVTVGIEWMAQMLVAQENILAETKTRSGVK